MNDEKLSQTKNKHLGKESVLCDKFICDDIG